jgi:hypothetical protein
MIHEWLDCAARSAAVLLVSTAAAGLLRGQSAALRHSVWSAALAATVLLVPLSVVTPAFRIPLDLPERVHGPRTESASGSFELRPDHAPAYDRWILGARRPGAASAMPGAHGRTPGGGLIAWIPPVWAIGASFLLLRIVLARVQLARVRRSARPIAEPSVLALANEIAGRMGVRDFELLSSREIATPVAFGLFRAAVMLPAAATSWPRERLRVALVHELCHLRRRDALTQLVGDVAQAIHWYDPLARLAVRRLTLERERACDDEVLRGGVRGVDYAGHLVSMAGSLVRRRGLPGSALTMARVSGLEARLLSILAPAPRRRALTRSELGLVAGGSLLAILALSSIGLRPATAGPPSRTRLDAPPARPEAPREVEDGRPDAPDTAPDGAIVEPLETSPAARASAGEYGDPASEVVDFDHPPPSPSADEIRSSPERELIERLVAGARHEKTWE